MKYPGKIVLLISALILLMRPAFAQVTISPSEQPTTDEQLAAQYFQNKEYDKAVIYYEKLFTKKPGNALYYRYYLSCLLYLKDYDKAEKTVKKLIRQNSDALNYMVDLGMVYKTSGNESKSKDQFEKAIKQVKANQQQVFTLANAFVGIKEFDHALETYRKGKKLITSYPFSFEMAEVYKEKGDMQSMIGEYLDMLLVNDGYIQQVQNALQADVTSEGSTERNAIIKSELIKRVQKYPEKNIFSEMLVWLLVQQKDFESALVQAKALDKRMKEDGTRLMALGNLCVSNQEYGTAVKAYEYVVSKGKESYYYVNARMEMLNAFYKKITEQGNYTRPDVQELQKNYTATLEELGKSASTVPMMKNLAHLQAFYLNDQQSATDLLNEAIAMPSASALTLAECKLELADILLMNNSVWDASLMYSQVEKDFKHEPIGQEAKFRNARLSYYIGDFKWAQTQLDVLKGATSKLIANDAMELSLVITDNTTLDTDATPLQMFARADLLAYQNKDSLALLTLDSISKDYPDHSLSDDILYKKYQIGFRKGKYEVAAGFLQKIIDNYGSDILADDASFKLAELYEYRLNNKDKAKELYEQVVLKFPGSLYTVEARKRFRRLRGDNVN